MKKILAVFLCVMLCAAYTPAIAFAVVSGPRANSVNANTLEDTSVSIEFDCNSDDPGAIITITCDSASQEGGSIVNNNNGTCIYMPASDFVGEDEFTYYGTDDYGQTSNVATVSIYVSAVNDSPVAEDDSCSVISGRTLSGDVKSNDSDVDNTSAELSVSLTNDASHGTLNLNTDGTFTYTPDESYLGSDSFEYELSDPDDASDTATVTIEVVANSIPYRSQQYPETQQGQVYSGHSYDVDLFLVFSDDDEDTLTWEVSTDGGDFVPCENTPYLDGDIFYYYQEETGYVTLTFRANDGDDYSVDTYTVELTVVADSDINNDGAVDMEDIAAIAQQYSNAYNAYDQNADGIINIYDIVVVAANIETS